MRGTLVFRYSEEGLCVAELHILFNGKVTLEADTLRAIEESLRYENALERIADLADATEGRSELTGVSAALETLTRIGRKAERFTPTGLGAETRKPLGYLVFSVELGLVRDLAVAYG